MKRCRNATLFAFAALALATPATWGQGFLVDRRPEVPINGSFEVETVEVDASVREQVARVRVSQTLANPTGATIEAEYLFPVPDAGAIQDFVLMVDGTEMPGELMDADKARGIYEDIVRRKRDPALLEYMGRALIRTRVFPIPPKAERTVTMTYSQLLKRDRDVVEFSYPFGTQKFTAKPIGRLAFSMRVESKTPIKAIYSPTHDIESDLNTDHEARVSWDARDTIPDGDLRVFYTVAEGGIGASVLSYRPDKHEDGYLLLLASPDVEADIDLENRSQSVVFVLDRSGSMSGEKIEQARDALAFVLNTLREGDTFNIVVYDDRVETFAPELQRLSRETRDEAARFVANIRAGGSTNIDSALRTALEMLKDDNKPQYVLFLTDGLPTAGATDELVIAKHARAANRDEARIFPFGVGFDVNARLLDRLSAENGGASAYVTPEQDIEAAVARVYSKMTSPVLAGLSVKFSGTDLNRTYPRDLPDLFEGGQLAWVGRYNESGPTTVTISGKVGGVRRSFTFEADLAEAGTGSRYDFVAPLWATRRIGALIDRIDLEGKNPELVDELVRLSTEYGILTPYTSFLAREETDLYALGANNRRAEVELERLSEVQGASGVGQRSNKALYQQADRAARAELAASPAHDQLSRGLGGMMGGGMGGMAGAGRSDGPASFGTLDDNRSLGLAPADAASLAKRKRTAGASAVALDFQGRATAVASVRLLGSKTFYLRDGVWVDSAVTPERRIEAEVIEQFTPGYFDLARSQGPDANRYLTFSDPVVVMLDDTVYRIDPPATP